MPDKNPQIVLISCTKLASMKHIKWKNIEKKNLFPFIFHLFYSLINSLQYWGYLRQIKKTQKNRNKKKKKTEKKFTLGSSLENAFIWQFSWNGKYFSFFFPKLKNFFVPLCCVVFYWMEHNKYKWREMKVFKKKNVYITFLSTFCLMDGN